MLFNSSGFLIFFPIVVVLYFVIPQKARNYWLLFASLFFYMCWNVKYVILLLISITTTYLAARVIEKTKFKKLSLFFCLVINFGILFVFKYFNFFSSTAVWMIGKATGIKIDPLSHSFLLPVGISFYTFQALSYLIDVYRGEIRAEKNIFKYALFVSFFPQLVAGPIERSKNLLSQFNEIHEYDENRVKHGLELMIWGYFEKLVVADRVAIFVNQIYDNYMGYAFWEIALATFGFAIQIYCDFGGYSHIAIGAAQVLGFKLCDNFRQPYFAISIKDFWRRWHISLSSWFRDYLYIPLGGNRHGRLAKYKNLFITFLISGLWHGASWSFVAWGCIHGLYQIIEDLLSPVKKKIESIFKINCSCASYKIFCIIPTFLMTSFAWIFFRASSGGHAFRVIRQMFSAYNPWVLFDLSLYNCGLDRKNVGILVASIFALGVVDLIHEKGFRIRSYIDKQNVLARMIICYLAVMIVLVFGIYGPKFELSKFIYFEF